MHSLGLGRRCIHQTHLQTTNSPSVPSTRPSTTESIVLTRIHFYRDNALLLRLFANDFHGGGRFAELIASIQSTLLLVSTYCTRSYVVSSKVHISLWSKRISFRVRGNQMARQSTERRHSYKQQMKPRGQAAIDGRRLHAPWI